MKDAIQDFEVLAETLDSATRFTLEKLVNEAWGAIRNEQKSTNIIPMSEHGVPPEMWEDFMKNGLESKNKDIAKARYKIACLLQFARYIKKHEINAVEVLKLLEIPTIDAMSRLENMPRIDFITLMHIVSKIDRNAQKKARSSLAKLAAAARVANDPKQVTLHAIENEFKKSTYPFHKRGYKARFAKEMYEKYPGIESIKTIEKLVTRLSKNIP